MSRPVLFDAVLLDLDGTLVATDRFWVQAARTGARRAFEDLGIERELPSRDEWLSMVGLEIDEGFRAVFSDLSESQRRTVREACDEEQYRLVEAGGAALMPGAATLLPALREAGLAIGIASNCSRTYLEHMLSALDLASMVDEAYCLDTPGITNKAEMIERLLTVFDTRSAIMVGDRLGDRDAAWRNGIPHVHCAFGFAGSTGEEVEAEATITDLGELQDKLASRATTVAETLERIGFGEADDPRPAILGVSGDAASGKSLFARDMARLLRSRGVHAVSVTLEAFARSGAPGAPGGRGETGEVRYVEDWFDLERLDRELFDPWAREAPLEVSAEAYLDRDAPALDGPVRVVVLEGPFLFEPRIHSRLTRTVHLDVPEDLRWRRLVGRGGAPDAGGTRSGDAASLEAYRTRCDPHRLADVVLDASNPLAVPAHAPRGA